jgi:hypothetical protein
MAMFDLQKSIWLKGTVVSYEPVNPHARLTLDQKTENGPLQRWLVEGPNLNRLHRMGVDKDFLNADPLGRQAWCAGQTYTSVASTAPKMFVDDVNRLMANHCE